MKVKNRIYIYITVFAYIFIMIILGVFYYKNSALYNSDTEEKSQFFLRDTYAEKWSDLGDHIFLDTDKLGMTTLKTEYISVVSKRNLNGKNLKYWQVDIVKQRTPVYYEVKITDKVMAGTNILDNTEFVYTFGEWGRLQNKKVYLGNNENNDLDTVFEIQTEEIIRVFEECSNYYKSLLENISREEYILNKRNIVLGMVISSVIMLLLLCFYLVNLKKLYLNIKILTKKL